MEAEFKKVIEALHKYVKETPVDVIKQHLIDAGHGIIDDIHIQPSEESMPVVKNTSIENSVFTWEGWDGDTTCLTFYNCTFVRDFGDFKKGDTVPCIFFVLETSEFEIVVDNDDHKKNIHYRVRLEFESKIDG